MVGWRRGGGATTWAVGVCIFVGGVVAGFTGEGAHQYRVGQWIAINAKDGINATGDGSCFNVLDFGQMYGIHVMLLPSLVTFRLGHDRDATTTKGHHGVPSPSGCGPTGGISPVSSARSR